MEFSVSTHGFTDIVDITDKVRRACAKTGVKSGIAHIFVAGSTAALSTIEYESGAITDLKRFARQRPGAFLAGALATGFVTGRLLKAADTHSLMEAAKQDGDRRSDGTSAAGQWTSLTGAEPTLSPVAVDLTNEVP